ncbi:GAF domain-containing sensor histidine kinase [Myxococcus sp. CA051A]|uniref:histidine kinase n=1 Tax=Myxococcus llanfairpwllgwyngyllgogerychwyrndrobwllllantysiliogogogochensis TaxID=2590453 RepID=A0A540X648_9BACT|nr:MULTISPECIES: GAF domain-containing sensor histidine kinase [Myxococcus]NTX04778.1 GAF domain-containing sensor histidine kinase [Myxococcus sp. CA040A]NTX15123.1 GAF domain-containing sensor histidine kinase [Myxococcus sp. CA056]NTX36123.1 GAF domain-containing sensor histidine kinase [Myxococcus sp. CA033]NTX52358.1 GAF domain-containing sensor histidine kinase [Myxococcus sp. CA039A]NTX63852.1 GAF domain-containing sensor histidine kinase [Myxococcus sp. CA051A]
MRRFQERLPLEALTFDDALVLLDVVQELAHLRTLEDVMALVRRAARQLSGADGVTFVLREGNLVHYADEEAIAPLWKGHRFPIESCISGWAILNREPVVIEDIYADDRIPHDVYRATFVKSLVMVPVRRADPVGAIGAYWAERRVPGIREVSLLQSLADSAAVAVENGRLYEAERAARRAAESETRLRRELLAMVSHDLRNPLGVIAMTSSLLAPLLSPLNGRARHHLDTLNRSALRMERLIHDLLDFAAIEGGGFRVSRVPLALSRLLEQASELGPLAQERGIGLELRVPERDVDVRCDPDRIHQVFSNLVGNAVRFTPAGGRITVMAEVHADWVELSVEDTGAGIAPEVLPVLFDRLQRPTRVPGSGVGLGLSITRGIVEAHGGAVRVRSELGQGTTFTFTLPMEG